MNYKNGKTKYKTIVGIGRIKIKLKNVGLNDKNSNP